VIKRDLHQIERDEHIRPDGGAKPLGQASPPVVSFGDEVADDVASGSDDADLDALQDLLVGPYRQQAHDLETKLSAMQAELAELERTINDKQALVDTMTPIVASSIRQSISESREEMIDALYPILGRLVTRAVSESMRELVHRIDAQMRNAFSMQTIARRMKARTMGVSEAELILREALPFKVHEVFLIHRETGILLRFASAEPAVSGDFDLISRMLTAIRDFAQDAFGRSEEGELDEIQYGETTILLEAAQRVYLAVVTEGVIPPGFRTGVRERLYQIEADMSITLRDFDGDVSVFEAVSPMLNQLLYEGVSDYPARHAPTTRDSPRLKFTHNQISMLIAWLMIAAGLAFLIWLLWEMATTFFGGAYLTPGLEGLLIAPFYRAKPGAGYTEDSVEFKGDP